MSDEVGKSFSEAVQVTVRLVVSEEGENQVGLCPGQPFVGCAEIGRAKADCQLVGCVAQVANRQFMPWEPALQVCLQPAVMLHPLSKSVANQADVIALANLQILGETIAGGSR